MQLRDLQSGGTSNFSSPMIVTSLLFLITFLLPIPSNPATHSLPSAISAIYLLSFVLCFSPQWGFKAIYIILPSIYPHNNLIKLTISAKSVKLAQSYSVNLYSGMGIQIWISQSPIYPLHHTDFCGVAIAEYHSKHPGWVFLYYEFYGIIRQLKFHGTKLFCDCCRAWVWRVFPQRPKQSGKKCSAIPRLLWQKLRLGGWKCCGWLPMNTQGIHFMKMQALLLSFM